LGFKNISLTINEQNLFVEGKESIRMKYYEHLKKQNCAIETRILVLFSRYSVIKHFKQFKAFAILS